MTVGVTVMKLANRMMACALAIVLLFGLFAGCAKSDDGGVGAGNEIPDNGESKAEIEAGAGADAAVEQGTLAKIAVANSISTIAVGADLSFAIRDDGCLLAWGNNSFLTAGKYPPHSKPRSREIMENVTSVSTGKLHTMAVGDDGGLWVWNNDEFSQTGDGRITDLATPVRIMDDVRAVSVGEAHAVAVRSDGSLWAWGDNESGQLGDGTTTSRQAPFKIMDNIAAISAGQWHTMAIGEDGYLWAWGGNTHGQLGDNAMTIRLEPVRIMENVFAVSAGHTHTMAIRTDGSLWAWGNNKFGQLGDGTTIDRYAPVKILEDVIAVSVGAEHTMAVRTDGSLWVWGIDLDGRLGISYADSNYGYTIEPEPLKTLEGITSVSAGKYYSMACGADGSLWLQGGRKLGENGQSYTVNRGYPTDIMDNVMSPPRVFQGEWQPAAPEPFPGKIALITSPGDRSGEEYKSLMALINKYGVDKIVHRDWYEGYYIRREEGVSVLVEIAADPDVRALVITPNMDGTIDAIEKFRRIRDDVFVVVVNFWEFLPDVAAKVDLAIGTNRFLMGESIVLHANKLGAKNFVHYSPLNRMWEPSVVARRDLIKETCERIGLGFFEVETPYAIYTDGINHAQQLIAEDLPKRVAELGRDTAFYSPSCVLQWTLVTGVFDTGAIFPQSCHPSPDHRFEFPLSASQIALIDDTYGVDYRLHRRISMRDNIESTRRAVEGRGVSGRISSWPVSEYMIWLNAGVEYAVKWINGEVPEDTIDYEVLSSICAEYTKEAMGEDLGTTFEPYSHNGRVYRHWAMGLMDYLVY